MDAGIGARIGELISALGIKKVRFAERVNVDQSYITHLVKGRNEPSDRVIESICRSFNVNEEWLRSGDGEMFLSEAGNTLDGLKTQYGLSDQELRLIEKVLNLRPELRKNAISYIVETAAALSAEEDSEENK